MKHYLKYIKSYAPVLRFAIDEEPTTLTTNPPSPVLDSPLHGEFQTLHGWCFFPYGTVVLELRLGKIQLDFRLPVDERPDVAHEYQFLLRSGSSGFRLYIPSELLLYASTSSPLTLTAYYAGKKKTIWKCTSGGAQHHGDADLERVLAKYYPEREVAPRAQKARIEGMAEGGDRTLNTHVITERERKVLSWLSNSRKSTLLIFGSNVTAPTGQSTWEYLREKISAENYTFVRVSDLSDAPATKDSLYDISLRSLIEYHLNHLPPPSTPVAHLVVNWESVQDAFLCSNILCSGSVFHLMDETILAALETTHASKQKRLQLAINSYAIPLLTSSAIGKEVKKIAPYAAAPLVLTDALFSEAPLHGKLFEQFVTTSSIENEREDIAIGRNLSLIVPVYNALESTMRCLRAARQALGDGDQLIVVDDCSDRYVSESLRDYCRQHRIFTYITMEENRGYLESCYSGLQAAEPKNDILLLNTDVVLPVKAIEKIKVALKKEPNIDLASPLLTNSSTLTLRPIPGHSLEILNNWIHNNTTPAFPSLITPEAHCLFISRRLINRLGFFERFLDGAFYQTCDLGMRARLHGARIACFDNWVAFQEPSALSGEKTPDILHKRSQQLFERRWGKAFELLSRPNSIKEHLEAIRNRYHSSFQEKYAEPAVPHAIQDILDGPGKNNFSVTPSERPMSLPKDSEIVFILPSVVAGGGSLSVLQHANEMVLRQIPVAVISLSPINRDLYPSLVEILEMTPHGLLEIPWSNQQIIATFWSTAYPVAEVCRRHPNVTGWYYVQDYEPWFHQGQPEFIAAAEKSYHLGLQSVVKTGFLKRLIEERHSVSAMKISPGVATDVFYPGAQDTHQGRMRVSALYRPQTPRRGPAETLEVIRLVQHMLPEIDFTLFGSSESLPKAFAGTVNLVGELTQREVASLYRNSDILLDMSHWHGFGRMGIEAMAAGAVPVLSDSGGIREYAKHAKNSLICGTSHIKDAADYICMLAVDREARLSLRRRGIEAAHRFTEEKATTDWLTLIQSSAQSSASRDAIGLKESI